MRSEKNSQMSSLQPRRKSASLRVLLVAMAAMTGEMLSCLIAPMPQAAEIAGSVIAVTVIEDEPQLPKATPRVGRIRRGPNGQIELVDPTTENGKAARLCSAGTICVGVGQAYPTLSAALVVAREGDVIEIAGGMYRESAKINVPKLTVRGVVGQPHFDCAGLELAEDKSCLLLAADGITLENIEISGAAIADNAGANGACVRNDPDMSFTLRGIVCHSSQEGILSNGGGIIIENSEFYDNGWTERTHNVFFTGNCSVTVRGSTFRDARLGHEFKSRCFRTTISDSTFVSSSGSRNIDITDGGETMIYRSTLVKGRGAENYGIISFASDACVHPGDMVLKEVHIVNAQPQAEIRNSDKCAGRSIILQGVTFEGSVPKEYGFIKTDREISEVSALSSDIHLGRPLQP